ncbi:unnamed protein product [Cylindrotheca closterium]|uniref:Uncharacterized protein n=1 Tax=Cylindrotheca closterium TaxID=2856 RepID=A0AAD2GA81_9STRA|nr:unnamed protein product [Cylindrotheca closterium]
MSPSPLPSLPRTMILCYFFLLCLSTITNHSIQSVSAFHKTTTASSRRIINNGRFNNAAAADDDQLLLTSTTSSTAEVDEFRSERRTDTSESSSSSSSPLSRRGIVSGILNLKGGSSTAASPATTTTTTTTRTIFPPPIDTIIPFVRNKQASATTTSDSDTSTTTTTTTTTSLQTFLIQHKTTLLTMVLMGFSGVVEAICYRRFKMYPNMMTGNTIKAMDAITSLNWQGIQVSLGLIGSYMSGATLYKCLDRARIFQSRNNHRRSIPNLVWLSAISFLLFGWSDVVGMTSNMDVLRLLPMATAFGMINCATQEMTGFVTNAATGHLGKIGFGLGESLVMNMLPRADHVVDQKTIQYGITSALTIGSFITTVIITNLIGLWLDAKHSWVYSRLPPLGLSLGAAYTILLTSYHYFFEKDVACK